MKLSPNKMLATIIATSKTNAVEKLRKLMMRIEVRLNAR